MCVNLSQLRYRKRGPTLHDMSTVPLSLSSENSPNSEPQWFRAWKRCDNLTWNGNGSLTIPEINIDPAKQIGGFQDYIPLRLVILRVYGSWGAFQFTVGNYSPYLLYNSSWGCCEVTKNWSGSDRSQPTNLGIRQYITRQQLCYIPIYSHHTWRYEHTTNIGNAW